MRIGRGRGREGGVGDTDSLDDERREAQKLSLRPWLSLTIGDKPPKKRQRARTISALQWRAWTLSRRKGWLRFRLGPLGAFLIIYFTLHVYRLQSAPNSHLRQAKPFPGVRPFLIIQQGQRTSTSHSIASRSPTHSTTVGMSTVAEDLLNDFGSSGDEAEDGEQNGADGLLLHEQPDTNGGGGHDRDAMDVDGVEAGDKAGEDGSEDADPDDAEATKAKVEKMQLGSVKDVRSVASLMQTLEPVIEVSTFPFSLQSSRHLCRSTCMSCGRLVYICLSMRTSPNVNPSNETENQSLSSRGRLADHGGRQHRRSSRISPVDPVQQPLNAN